MTKKDIWARAHERFWAPAAQTLDAASLAVLQSEAITEAWNRLWHLPLGFYHAKYAAAGLSADAVPDLVAVPTTTKQEWRDDEAAHPPMGTYRSVGVEQAARMVRSSGTTGRAFVTLFGERDVAAADDAYSRQFWRAGIRPSSRVSNSFWGSAYGSALSDIAFEIPVGVPVNADAARDHIEVWRLLRPTTYFLSGAQLTSYLEAARSLGLDPKELFATRTLALLDLACQFEPARRRTEARTGATVLLLGGLADVPGFGPGDCDAHDGFHVPADYFVIEAVDPATGQVVADGDRGHLVVTTLQMDTLMFRFDTEDIVTITRDPCPCGEAGPRYRLLGRQADVLSVGGTEVLPLDVELALVPFDSPEFQVRVDDDRLVVVVERDSELDALADALAEATEVGVRVESTVPGSIPRASRKASRVVRG